MKRNVGPEETRLSGCTVLTAKCKGLTGTLLSTSPRQLKDISKSWGTEGQREEFATCTYHLLRSLHFPKEARNRYTFIWVYPSEEEATVNAVPTLYQQPISTLKKGWLKRQLNYKGHYQFQSLTFQNHFEVQLWMHLNTLNLCLFLFFICTDLKSTA